MNDLSATQAPDVTLKAYGHGREISFGNPGVPMVLVCVARETSDQPPPIVSAIREVYPLASQVLICNIADLRSIPKLIKMIVEQLMKSSYNDAVKSLAPGRPAEDYVLIMPEWDGDLLRPLGIDDVTRTVAVVVLAADGRVVLRHQGEDAGSQALRALEPLMERVPA
jgi:hypothetical protein